MIIHSIKLKETISKGLSLISYLFPKKKNLWVFGAWQGNQYSDNSKYLFEYIQEMHPEICAVWLTRNKSLVSEIIKKGYACYYRFSIRGIICTLRAEIAFETEGNRDISPFLNNKKTKTIQLWHGFPLKAMQWKSDDGSLKMRSAELLNKFYWISCSDNYTRLMNNLLGVNIDRFRLTGFPRNDTFIKSVVNKEVKSFMDKRSDCKYVIYMPTHRNFGLGENRHINVDVFHKIDLELEKSKIVLVYKPHFHEMKNFAGSENSFQNIHFAVEPFWRDVYSYIYMFDLLISDYSSVIVDFLYCNKPIILFTYDLEDYKKNDAGLTEYFYNVPIGPLCYSWDEVIEQSNSLLLEDTWKTIREKNIGVFQHFNDGRNCERVFKYAVDILNDVNSRA